MVETETIGIMVSLPLLWALLRCGLTFSFCIILGSWLGKLASGLSPKEQFRIKIVAFLIFAAGLLFPAP